MDSKEKLDVYVSSLYDLIVQSYTPEKKDELHFPDPDFLDTLIWSVVISPLASIVALNLYSRFENCFSYKDAQVRLHPDELKLLAKTISELINSEAGYYNKNVYQTIKTNLKLEEENSLDLKMEIEKLVESLREVRKIIILSSNPRNTSRLRLDEEFREIDEGLRRANKRDRFKIEQRLAVRAKDLRRALLDVEPNIVHFSGHGAGVAGIALEDEQGQSSLVTTEALAGLFKLCATHIECVVLNACYSSIQADAIAQHIDYVIGMDQEIGDVASIKFTTGFYDALGAGKSIDIAFEFGCNSIHLENIPEHLIPQIKKKMEFKE